MRKQIGFVISAIGWSPLLPPVREFFKALFWDRVLSVMNPYLPEAAGLILGYGPFVLLTGAGLYLLLGPKQTYSLRKWVRTKLNWYLVTMGAFLLGALCCLVLYFWDQNRGPVIWQNYAPASPIAWWREQGGPLLFSAFQIIGVNRSSDPVTPSDAYIVSNISGIKVPLTFNNQKPINSGTIEPGARFILFSTEPWLNPQTRISPGVFQQEFGSFTFVFESPQKNYTFRFDKADVDALIALSDNEIRVDSPPRVIFKDQK